MAIKLIANYSKRLGLPGYSSHQFSLSVESELAVTDDIAKESERLYQLLQTNVDEQILQTGFVPPTEYGLESCISHNPNGSPTPPQTLTQWPRGPEWKCSAKQKELILNLVEEHQLDKNAVESLAQERFGKGVRQLNKVEASGLIDELLEIHGPQVHHGRHDRGKRNAYQGNGRRAA